MEKISVISKKIVNLITTIIFLGLIFTIFYINIHISGYIHNGYYVTYSPSSFKYLYLSFGLLALFLVVNNYLKITKRGFVFLLILINLSALILRIVLINSFDILPTGDSWQIFSSIYDLVFNHSISPFLKGGYIGTYSNQLGFGIFLIPLIKIFGTDFNAYYFLNAFILQASILLLTFAFLKKENYKTSFWINIGLNLLIPNFFYQFIFYSDPLSLLLISVSIYLIVKSKFTTYIEFVALVLMLGLSIIIRAYAIVLIIATLILVIFDFIEVSKLKKVIFIVLLGLTAFIPQRITENIFNKSYNTTVGEYSLPSSTWIAIGLNGSGFTPEYINYFYSVDYNQDLVKKYIQESISTRYKNLYDLDFLSSKITYSWSNQDFDSLSYIMPQEWGASLQDFYDDNSLRLGRASGNSGPTNVFGETIYKYLFSIRNIEKVYLLFLLELAVIGAFFNLKKNDKYSFFAQLIFIGFTLLFIILETQPRYLFIAVNILTLFSFKSLSDIPRVQMNK